MHTHPVPVVFTVVRTCSMITAGLLLTAVAHPGMLFPNEILDSPVPADILNGSCTKVGQVSSRGSQLRSAATKQGFAYQNREARTISNGSRVNVQRKAL